MRPSKIAGGPIAGYVDWGGRYCDVDYPRDVFANDTSYYKPVCGGLIGLRYDDYTNINADLDSLSNPRFYQTWYCLDYNTGRMFHAGFVWIFNRSI